MAENRKGKDGRFYFSRGQMVLLGAAFTLASVIIFMLGMFVGKSIEGRRLFKKEEPLVKIPIKPAESGPAPAKNEITFNEKSSKPAAANPPEEPGNAAPAAQRTPKAQAREAAAPVAEKKPEKAARSDETAKRAEAPEADAKEAGKLWRAQVNAFPDERSARQIVDRLKNKGYNAYVTEVQNRGKSWYRVNVGKYNSREEADKTVELLRTKENFPKAFAASR